MSSNQLESNSAAAPTLPSPAAQLKLERYLRERVQAGHVAINHMAKLSGGAIQENWALNVTVIGGPYAGGQDWVLRTDAPSGVAVSLTRAQEFAVLNVAYDARVTVPRPLWLCTDSTVLGRDFFIMQRIQGTAAGHRLTRGTELVPDPAALAESLGSNLALLHTVTPARAELDFFPAPLANHALGTIAIYRNYLDSIADAYPGLEWGLRWCELYAPTDGLTTLIHRDYRTGNYMVHDGRLTGVLDWEFAAWGDPREDIGWFMAKCWRFLGPDREAGGISSAKDFLRGYQQVSNRSFTAAELKYWQVMGHLRWAIIALQQGQRHLSGEQPSLELALTGRMVAELEYEIIKMTSGEQHE
jgi:aminoglycoside phosphotransferase (APT) family kinase protein